MLIRLPGRSGRVWVIDTREQAAPGAKTTPYYGWEEGIKDGPRFWCQLAIGGEEWADDQRHLKRAYEVARLPAVAECPYILSPLDLVEGFDVWLVSPLAQTSLHEVLLQRPLEASEVAELERRLRGALDALHGLGPGLVHSDLREDNVLLHGDGWKLADLGGVVPRGCPITAVQKDPEYVRPGAALGEPADPENDLYALAVVLDHASRGLAER